SEVQAVINIDGILDFTDPAESGKDNDPDKPSDGKLWLGYSFKEKPEIWIEASPLNYVNDKTPPFAFINSSVERFHAGRDEFVEKLNNFNTYSETHTIPNTPHTFWLFHPWFEKTLQYILSFLEKAFKYN
ncbi:MAG: pectin esterase, partial [Ignavibacteriae bacterium HGW-Ignavibacteriae-3]